MTRPKRFLIALAVLLTAVYAAAPLWLPDLLPVK
jgi:hypothetical protein